MTQQDERAHSGHRCDRHDSPPAADPCNCHGHHDQRHDEQQPVRTAGKQCLTCLELMVCLEQMACPASRLPSQLHHGEMQVINREESEEGGNADKRGDPQVRGGRQQPVLHGARLEAAREQASHVAG